MHNLHASPALRWISIAFALNGALALATDYHVSPNGNDAANGTSPGTAWRTVDRVNQHTYQYQPGDRILFERGGTFRGEIIGGMSGTASGFITIGAYGTGARPIVKGSEVVTGWQQHQGNIWKAPVARRVDQLYVNGTRMTPARFPNTGWLRNANGGGNQLQSPDLTQPDGYWNGAKVVLRRTASSIDTLIVSSHANGLLTFTTSFPAIGQDDWGFFFTKKASELDAPGEWFHDAAAGMLYLRMPDDSAPSGATVEAAVHNEGVYVYWHRHHLRVEGIHFMHQRNSGVRVDDGNDIIVNDCRMERSYHGIRSVGTNCTYTNNTITGTYASGALLIDNTTLFENNTLTDIALIPGEGEHAWGYFGVRGIGPNIIMRGNRLDNIGYTALEVNRNTLVEKNVITRALATLNDGGGIAFDNADGLVIQDNIIRDLVGATDGSSTIMPHFQRMGNGIYFGNTNIKNTTVQRNTVADCPGAGINVDHTMVSTGYVVRNNVLFNNDIQLAVSDYSNYNGPGATPPYHVPNFNGVFEGNVMYCLNKDQLCMRQFNCYSANAVDFGTYTNNKYHNPYNEVSILVHNIYYGGPKYFSLERWRAEKENEAGSTRSPLRLTSQGVADVLSNNLVINGDFTNNVNGWGGWPTNSSVQHVTTHLDNGALRAHLPDNSVYPSFSLRNPDWFPIESGQWYRLHLTVQSDAPGELLAGLKGNSQLSNPYAVYQQRIPFDQERRDLDIIFQSTMTDQAQVMLINQWTDPTYYLDNVQLHKVAVVALDPRDKQDIFINQTAAPQAFALNGCWSELNGTLHEQSITIAPYSSKVLVRETDIACMSMGASEDLRRPAPGLYPNPVEPGGQLNAGSPLNGTARLASLTGQQMASERLAGAQTINIPHGLVPGVYVLIFNGPSGAFTERVVVR